MGTKSCDIESCSSTSIICNTQSAYTTYSIDNTGVDSSKLKKLAIKIKSHKWKIIKIIEILLIKKNMELVMHGVMHI